MELKRFQIEAINKLFDACENERISHIVVKSPTGSGKTIMLTRFIKDFCRAHNKIVFIWLTPGNGNLEEQSKKKMDDYIAESHTKLLGDILTGGFEEGDACFVNWELLTKKDNVALRDSERDNFEDKVKKAHAAGLRFFVVIDESHQNDTNKSKVILDILKPKKIIRASATPVVSKERDHLIEIDEADVIAQGLIKKLIVINEDFPQKIQDVDLVEYLLEKALEKQSALRSEFQKRKVLVNPMILVQLPNNDEGVKTQVENFFASREVTFENGLLAKWLSDAKEKINLDGIEKNNAAPVALIMKQAVATGWDCPRAHILVKLRPQTGEDMSTFDIQTIGRIRRMPQALHYENELLDSCYLYTFDEKFANEVRTSLKDGAVDAKKISLKDDFKKFVLTKQQRKEMAGEKRNLRETTKAIAIYMKQKYSLGDDFSENAKKLQAFQFAMGSKIIDRTKSGIATLLTSLETEQKNFNEVDFFSEVNTHGAHGLAYKHAVHLIGKEIGIEYSQTNKIIRKIFCEKPRFDEKILKQNYRELYAFVINNADDLRHIFREAMAAEIENETPVLNYDMIVEHDFHFPQTEIFNYNGKSPYQEEFTKNVYKGYLKSASRSAPEKEFEKYLEKNPAVVWWYKNGDKGDEYFSLVYLDNGKKQKLFYPDYVLSLNGEIWICETKGGFTSSGQSEDIDKYSAKKFEVLKLYCKQNNLHGGFVRFDEGERELFIALEKYSEEFDAECWKLLDDVWE